MRPSQYEATGEGPIVGVRTQDLAASHRLDDLRQRQGIRIRFLVGMVGDAEAVGVYRLDDAGEFQMSHALFIGILPVGRVKPCD